MYTELISRTERGNQDLMTYHTSRNATYEVVIIFYVRGWDYRGRVKKQMVHIVTQCQLKVAFIFSPLLATILKYYPIAPPKYLKVNEM